MKHFYLIANSQKERTGQLAREIAEYLQSRGASCTGSHQKQTREITEAGTGGGYTSISNIPEDTQCVITLGGDGTLIQAARDLVELQLPLAGINMGHLGYLTQVSGGEGLFPFLDALLEDRYTLEKRMMLEGRIVKKETERIRAG